MYWNINNGTLLFVSTRLIETWDVLKCIYLIIAWISLPGLIETWDVLKL